MHLVFMSEEEEQFSEAQNRKQSGAEAVKSSKLLLNGLYLRLA